ncbi:MAG: hypothetical protein CMD01_02575 [Flavobacteriales bacterium]|nr:hypothetical protein [Flavobacteriales bacterium]|tara:strand:+ start:4320 stop:4715 length:396 start_codon:yes stop_codon:yes gene_type:complete
MNNLKFTIALLSLVLFSCSKTEGVGGNGTIKGRVSVANINVLGTVTDTYDAQEEDVYIIYGDLDNTHDDDVKTSHDGTFEFKYLNTGNYEIYVYSECLTCPNGQDSLIKINTSIQNRSDIIDIGTITIANY